MSDTQPNLTSPQALAPFPAFQWQIPPCPLLCPNASACLAANGRLDAHHIICRLPYVYKTRLLTASFSIPVYYLLSPAFLEPSVLPPYPHSATFSTRSHPPSSCSRALSPRTPPRPPASPRVAAPSRSLHHRHPSAPPRAVTARCSSKRPSRPPLIAPRPTLLPRHIAV
ncbi:hypothetical protein BC834DRAFT_877404 [Gloeopeniophorella convolvens]|nr:hypothetical protein BC834DRAFT_877404 [Gloeopeniophorella convolvens]